MTKHYSIAIDGPAGAGKSTIARTIAKKTRFVYLDTGAMYRALALWLTQKGVDVTDREAVAKYAHDIDIDVKYMDGEQRMFAGGRDVTGEIREPGVSMLASAVSKHPEIRECLVDMQRRIAEGTNVVMDGRDIGTKVLPNASVKIFLIASVEARAERRLLQLRESGIEEPYDKILADMIKRDHDDSTRQFSPLVKASDAVTLDTTHLTLERSIESALAIVDEKIGDIGALGGDGD